MREPQNPPTVIEFLHTNAFTHSTKATKLMMGQ
jgi:hypothetical protein